MKRVVQMKVPRDLRSPRAAAMLRIAGVITRTEARLARLPARDEPKRAFFEATIIVLCHALEQAHRLNAEALKMSPWDLSPAVARAGLIAAGHPRDAVRDMLYGAAVIHYARYLLAVEDEPAITAAPNVVRLVAGG